MAYKMKNCPLCGNYGRTDEHHIYPQAYFNGDGPTINLCHNCHQGGVEQIMPRKSLTPSEYRKIFIKYVEIQCLIHKTDKMKALKLAFGNFQTEE